MHKQLSHAETITRRLAVCMLAPVLCAGLGGCAAVTNPVAGGVPVRRLPPDALPTPKEDEKTIPLTLLRQKAPDAYRLDAGDVLGVYIEGVLGDKGQPPPVRYSELGNVPPALGYPIPVRDDGAVPLPLVGSVPVRGLTVAEAEKRIIKAYTVDKEILKPDRERIIISLIKQRDYHVLVVRQDSGGVTLGAQGTLGNTKRGTGAVVDLPAYENDVLNALTRTGGLPGLDAMNEVVIQRGNAQNRGDSGAGYPPDFCPACPLAAPVAGDTAVNSGGQVIRIPLRLRPDEPLPFKPEDVLLQTGDIVFIEARDTEVYYTGGLLFPRQFVLPRDYDLRVVDAVALAGGPLVNGGVTQNNLSGTIIASGLGSPSPSELTVLRKTKCQGQLKIKVDLNRALNDPRENILVEAGDVLILQETPGEAVTRYLTTVLRFQYLGTLLNQRDFSATSTANLP
jgi:protein involved in polysaccharide export with SLBB domain